MWAAMKGHTKIVEMLINNGAGVNARGDDGYMVFIRVGESCSYFSSLKTCAIVSHACAELTTQKQFFVIQFTERT